MKCSKELTNEKTQRIIINSPCPSKTAISKKINDTWN